MSTKPSRDPKDPNQSQHIDKNDLECIKSYHIRNVTFDIESIHIKLYVSQNVLSKKLYTHSSIKTNNSLLHSHHYF